MSRFPDEELPLFRRAREHGERPALDAPEGTWTYADLLAAAKRVRRGLLAGREGGDLGEERIPFLAPPGLDFTALLWGIWAAGGIAVPLALAHPAAELAYVLEDTGAVRAIAAGIDPGKSDEGDDDFADRLAAAGRLVAEKAGGGVEILRGEDLLAGVGAGVGVGVDVGAGAGEAGPDAGEMGPAPLGEDRRALMVYTSGSTGRPKGVVWTHGMVAFHCANLAEAWGWEPADRALLMLPLHHVHGLVNVLLTSLWTGAVCEVMPRFEVRRVWERLASGEVSVLMAVPTLYHRLLAARDKAAPEEREAWSTGARKARLMVSGSAALPVETLERWREAAGHTLLERYGMTEIGMALSNPYRDERRAGHVGRPLPGVEVRRVGEGGEVLPEGGPGGLEPGELEVRGPGVFREYWGRPEATREAFRDGGWFRTGDVALVDGGAYRLLGRTSVDILKSGGYKISALEVEAVLRRHPAVAECAVVGLPDPEWGERVAAAVVPRTAEHASRDPEGSPLNLEGLRAWAREHLAPYKLPTRLLVVEDLPRNALGKVVKPRVVELFTSEETGPET